MDQLVSEQDNAKIPQGLNTFIGKSEIPEELQKWRDQLKDNQNPGLALRWIAALSEMELTMAIPVEMRNESTKKWREDVI